jgi:predicted nucleic acid-binding Zn ribbon protein
MAQQEAKQGNVTGRRRIFGNSSWKRNDEGHFDRSVEAHTCHWCRDPFESGQVRYPIFESIRHGNGYWGLVSVCGPCWQHAQTNGNITECMYITLDRQQCSCAGCGEPIMTNTNYRALKWRICSNRCYQRQYRKRRRANRVDRKGEYHRQHCAACGHYMPADKKRRDAKFCSDKCRQWQYRRRRQTGARPPTPAKARRL